MQKRKLLEGALRTATVLTLVLRLKAGEWWDICLCALALGLYGLPELVERRFGVVLPGAMRCLILGFVFASEILGEIFGWYQAVVWWDLALHTISGFFVCAVGWFLAERDGADGSGWRRGMAALCFSVTVGVVWEFFEWTADWLLGLDMQKDTVIHAIRSVRLAPAARGKALGYDGIREVLVVCADGRSHALKLGGYLDVGLNDTMGDLLVNFLGALAFAGLAQNPGRVGDWLKRNLVPRQDS